jgi:cysteinyl-tRNA synthetase
VGLVLTNTLSGRKEPLVPRKAGHVGIYWCGVTVYSRSHIGHARALITADVLCRYLRTRGFTVNFVRNFTDIEDKIIKRAREEGITTDALTSREISRFNEDVAWLRCLRPTHEPRATTHIAEMLAMIEALIADGYAYSVPDGSVYFRVRRFAGYGKLSHQHLDFMACDEDPDPAKEDAHDFALWKGAKPGDPEWPSPWGPGRPGWHIECSAMAAKYLGQPFEIHGGGSDLIFPHHENEIAQSEAAAGCGFADLWMHNGMVTSNSEKMSKSLGNILALSDVAKQGLPAEALRLLFLRTHYRAPLDYFAGGLEETQKGLDRLYETLARADEATGVHAPSPLDGALTGELEPFEQEFCAAMDDDLNAAKAVGLLFDRVKDLNRALDNGDMAIATAIRRQLGRVGPAVGILETRPAQYLESRRLAGRERAGISSDEIEAAIQARNDARNRKDFKEADRIRGDLKDRGILLEDGPDGTSWRPG